MRDGIAQIDGLKVLGALHSTVCTWAADSDDIDLYAVADQMAEKGWNTDRQQNPACVHCTVNAHNKSIVPDYLADLKEAVAYVRAHPELKNEGGRSHVRADGESTSKGFGSAQCSKGHGRYVQPFR